MKSLNVLIFFILFVSSAHSQTGGVDLLGPTGSADLNDKMNHFYINLSEEKFEAFQREVDLRHEEFQGLGINEPLHIALMIARVSEEKGWPITSREFGDTAKEILEGKSELAKIVVKDDLDVRFQHHVTFWWTSFFATGNDKYLEVAFKYAGLYATKIDPKKNLDTYSMNAFVSLKVGELFRAYCIKHEAVRKFAEQKLKKGGLPVSQTKFLVSCIEDAVGKQKKGGLTESQKKFLKSCIEDAIEKQIIPATLTQEDKSLEMLYIKAMEKAQAGDFEGAIAIFEQATKIYGPVGLEKYGPGFGELYFDYGGILLQLQQWAAARDSFKICVEDYPNPKPGEEKKSVIESRNYREKLAIFEWGYCEQKMNKPEEALKLYQRYLDSKPRPKEWEAMRSIYLLRLGGALIAAGKMDEGKTEITKLFKNSEKWKTQPQILKQAQKILDDANKLKAESSDPSKEFLSKAEANSQELLNIAGGNRRKCIVPAA